MKTSLKLIIALLCLGGMVALMTGCDSAGLPYDPQEQPEVVNIQLRSLPAGMEAIVFETSDLADTAIDTVFTPGSTELPAGDYLVLFRAPQGGYAPRIQALHLDGTEGELTVAENLSAVDGTFPTPTMDLTASAASVQVGHAVELTATATYAEAVTLALPGQCLFWTDAQRTYSWVPDRPGVFTITARADGQGGTATDEVVITVTPPPPPGTGPILVSQPGVCTAEVYDLNGPDPILVTTVAVDSLGVAVETDPGTVGVLFTKDGFRPVWRVVHMQVGEHPVVQVMLEELAGPPPLPPTISITLSPGACDDNTTVADPGDIITVNVHTTNGIYSQVWVDGMMYFSRQADWSFSFPAVRSITLLGTVIGHASQWANTQACLEVTLPPPPSGCTIVHLDTEDRLHCDHPRTVVGDITLAHNAGVVLVTAMLEYVQGQHGTAAIGLQPVTGGPVTWALTQFNDCPVIPALWGYIGYHERLAGWIYNIPAGTYHVVAWHGSEFSCAGAKCCDEIGISRVTIAHN